MTRISCTAGTETRSWVCKVVGRWKRATPGRRAKLFVFQGVLLLGRKGVFQVEIYIYIDSLQSQHLPTFLVNLNLYSLL